jgi:cardiolipin synthase
MLEVSTLPANYRKLLEERGIRAKAFSPIKPFISSHYNYRDHRKILVIDGKVAFNGGVNLADEYINRRERFGHWKDTAVMLKGDAVKSFTLMFLQMWNIDEPKPVFDPWLKEGGDLPEHPSGYVIPYGDCPLDNDKVGETVYMDILNRAEDYVHIMTPYLILDGELETALKYAAQRGVDVKIILPGIPDKEMPYALAKTHYKRLIEAGVKIYEYTPGFIHTKVIMNEHSVIVGTVNMDYRSFYLHYENGIWVYDRQFVGSVESDIAETIRVSREITYDEWKHRPRLRKLAQFILKVFDSLV